MSTPGAALPWSLTVPTSAPPGDCRGGDCRGWGDCRGGTAAGGLPRGGAATGGCGQLWTAHSSRASGWARGTGGPCPVTCDSGEHGLCRHGEEAHRAGAGSVRPAGVRHPGTLMVTAAGGPRPGGNLARCERDEQARGFWGSLYGNHCKHLGRGPARAGISSAPPEQTGALLCVLGWGGRRLVARSHGGSRPDPGT